MSVSENLKIGAGACNVTAMDSDAVQNLTFSLDDDAGGRFSFNNNVSCQSLLNETRCTTELLVSDSINFEETASLEVVIRVTDDKGLFYTKWFNLTVIDVNDPPSNVTLDGSTSVSVPENIRDVLIDSLITDDEDEAQNFTYALISDPGGKFRDQRRQTVCLRKGKSWFRVFSQIRNICQFYGQRQSSNEGNSITLYWPARR